MGWTLLAKATTNAFKATLLMSFAAHHLKGLVTSLTAEEIARIPREEAIQLTKDLQELHRLLASFCRSQNFEQLNRTFIGLIANKIRESTEDLGDIIEDLVLSESEEFKLLISECAQGISTAAHSGRM